MAATAQSPTASALQPSAANRPKVIYVMGQGKSGSTILGVTLGNCAGIFFGGELNTWMMTAGRPVYGGIERTRFWRSVREDVDCPRELVGSRSFHEFERSLAAIPRRRSAARGRLRERYRRVTVEMFQSIAARAGADYVVDTSHLPLRARELQEIDGIDLYLIFLVRDVEGVLGSYARFIKPHDVGERRRQFLTMNTHLWVTYLLSIAVFLRQRADRRLLLRHEDFVANPAGVLREILDFAGSPAEIPDLAQLRTGVPLKGNRLIASEVVALKPKAAAPYRRSRVMRLAQRPWTLVLDRLGPAAKGVAGHPRAAARDCSARG
jgi:hypothetical protein